MSVTTGQLTNDIREIADWISGVGSVLKSLPPGTIRVSGVPWVPPPAATPAPVASPKCLRPAQGSSTVTTEADLVAALETLSLWTQSVADTLKRLPTTTRIP
jgi:hypothetical protein